jgi:hypothetical protein
MLRFGWHCATVVTLLLYGTRWHPESAIWAISL